MIIYDGPVLPDDLTTFVRSIPVETTIQLDQILPNRTVNNNRVDLGTITKRARVARYRPYDGPIHVSQRDVAQTSWVQLPPLSDSLSMGEYERLQIEFARTGGTNQRAFVDAIYNDAEDLTRNVQRRAELARGDVLVDGKFTLAGEGGLYLEVDYGMNNALKQTASPLWNHVATGSYDATILSDLMDWTKDYVTINGFAPGGMWVNRSILSWMMLNAELRLATGSLLGANVLLNRPQLNALLDQHMLPPILGIYDTSLDVDGASTRVVSENLVVFVPPAGQPLGYTAWGLTATALELVGARDSSMTFSNAPGIVGVVDLASAPPYRKSTFVDAVGMPVIENPNYLMVATVGNL